MHSIDVKTWKEKATFVEKSRGSFRLIHRHFVLQVYSFTFVLCFPVQTILSPQFGQNFQSLLISNPHFLHATTHAILSIIHLHASDYSQQQF